MPRGIACCNVRASRALEKAAVKAFIVRRGPVKHANEEHVRKNILAADVRFQTRPACDFVHAEVTGSTPAPVGTRGSGAKCRSIYLFLDYTMVAGRKLIRAYGVPRICRGSGM